MTLNENHPQQTFLKITNDSLVDNLLSCITCGKSPLEGYNIKKRWLIIWKKNELENKFFEKLSYAWTK